MKRFFKYIILFSIPFVCTTVSLEIYLRNRPNIYKYKYEWMQKNAEDVEVLILGSSHTFRGIHPKTFKKKAFNLANVYQQAAQDVFLLKKWSGEYKQLKTVIFPISFFTWFIHGMENTHESHRCRYYKIYMNCELYSDFSLYNIALYDIKIKMEQNNLKSFFENDLQCDEYGWGTRTKDYNTWDKADDVVKVHTAKNWEAIENNIAIIKEMADFCRNRDIQLVLITTPCWHTYYELLDQKQLSKMYELTHALQKEYNLQYFDYLKDDRFNADDFYDSNHLSDIGAEKFTKILKRDLGL